MQEQTFFHVIIYQMKSQKELLRLYKKLVTKKYQRYNSLFITLPYPRLKEPGKTLPSFSQYCEKQLQNGQSPRQIVVNFFQNVHPATENEQQEMLIMFLQFIERQIVLFDSIEDSAFRETHDLTGEGSWEQFISKIKSAGLEQQLQALLENYRARFVLTAHPTQFYPSYILEIIHKLSLAVAKDDAEAIREILLQLGKTSLRNSKQPTPIDEAYYLTLQMGRSFYPALTQSKADIILLGFWPGGDRDGNPNVTAETTLEVAKILKERIIRRYRTELRNLSNKFTFPGVWEQLNFIRYRLKATLIAVSSDTKFSVKPYRTAAELKKDLLTILKVIEEQHNGLFKEDLLRVIKAIDIFGFYYASLDIRQNAIEHTNVLANVIGYKSSDDINLLLKAKKSLPTRKKLSAEAKDMLQYFKNIAVIQKNNGEMGCHRYIISHSEKANDILEVLLLSQLAGYSWQKFPCDIVPLFESIESLLNAKNVMQELFENVNYRKFLKNRKNTQTVMLGYSDSTKDGGYVMANWSIIQCKMALTELADSYGIEIIFFDGRGGPPARGGGNSYMFYKAVESMVPQHQVQLTVQGQTISSKFGARDSAKFNCEKIATAALSQKLLHESDYELSDKEYEIFDRFASRSYDAYQELKNDPLFIPYLTEITPLNYYGELNITSRPGRRKKSMKFDDLRAIPFVGAWTQMKQNVPGYFGLGTALSELIAQGHLATLKKWYKHWLFFRTLINNAMMSLSKSNFQLTEYLKKDPVFSEFWLKLYEEAELTKSLCLKTTKLKSLMAGDIVIEHSIEIREQIVLPLLIIQQYALDQLRNNAKKLSKKQKDFLHKLVLKTLATNINASRNAV